MKDQITPEHYGGADNPYEVIKVINAWGLNFELANVCKYIARSGKKDKSKHIEDLEKAKKYLELEIQKLKLRPWQDPSSFCIDEAGPVVVEGKSWDSMKITTGEDKIPENKENIALLDKALEEMDALSEEELVKRLKQNRNPINIVASEYMIPGIMMPFIDHQSTPGEIEKFTEAWSRGVEAAGNLRKYLGGKVFEERCKKTQDWVDSKKNEGITIEELVKFFENIFK